MIVATLKLCTKLDTHCKPAGTNKKKSITTLLSTCVGDTIRSKEGETTLFYHKVLVFKVTSEEIL